MGYLFNTDKFQPVPLPPMVARSTIADRFFYGAFDGAGERGAGI